MLWSFGQLLRRRSSDRLIWNRRRKRYFNYGGSDRSSFRTSTLQNYLSCFPRLCLFEEYRYIQIWRLEKFWKQSCDTSLPKLKHWCVIEEDKSGDVDFLHFAVLVQGRRPDPRRVEKRSQVIRWGHEFAAAQWKINVEFARFIEKQAFPVDLENIPLEGKINLWNSQ